MSQHRITQKQLLAHTGRVQSILKEILYKGTTVELNHFESMYTVFLKDGKDGMSEIACVQTTACCYQLFHALYEVLWLVQNSQKSRLQQQQRRMVKA